MSVAEPPPTHDGPCVESLDGDGKPLGYCVTCYQPTGREQEPHYRAPHAYIHVGHGRWTCETCRVWIRNNDCPYNAEWMARLSATAREQADEAADELCSVLDSMEAVGTQHDDAVIVSRSHYERWQRQIGRALLALDAHATAREQAPESSCYALLDPPTKESDGHAE